MSTKLEELPQRTAPADTFAGKKVVDKEGIRYGKVKHIHIDRDTLRVTGVTVHQGFHKDYYLSEKYIDRFTQETLLLSKSPIPVGTQVVDIDLHKLGKVKRLHRSSETDEIESIEISDGLLGSKILSKYDILGIGERVTLKMTKAEFKKLD